MDGLHVDRILYNEDEDQHYLIAVQEDFDALVTQGKLPHFGSSNRCAIRPCDPEGVPTAGWVIVDNLNHLTEPVVEVIKEGPAADGTEPDPVRYEGGLIFFTEDATAEDIIAFADANPTLLSDVIEAEKAGQGRVPLVAALTNLAGKNDVE